MAWFASHSHRALGVPMGRRGGGVLRRVSADVPTASGTERGIFGTLDLNLLMLFPAIVSAGSITRATSRLRVPKATLSRKLRELERQIGAVLLKRGPRGLE